jgi:predicted enzyme related to lactoylglutathione lyase
MQSPRFGLAVVYVKDIEKAKRFHTEALGLRIEREAPTFVQFDHFAIASDERLSEGNDAELYWIVDDAEDAYAEIRAKAEIARPLETKPFGKVFAARDPQGGVRFFVELAESRPSETV